MFIAPKILLPPGIGDVYWSLVKLQSFLKKKKMGKPDVYVACRPDKFGSENRAFDFIEQFPFVNSTRTVLNNDLAPDEFWTHAYTQKETGIFKDVIGCEYFVAYNGSINAGRSLEETDPEIACNWDTVLPGGSTRSPIAQKMWTRYTKYIVYHFGTRGTYRYWTDDFSVNQIVQSIKEISKNTETTPILVGGEWDREDPGLLQIRDSVPCVDMMGKTSFKEICGLIRGAEMVVGFPSGLSMISPMLGTKTLSLWSNLYPRRTRWNVVAPQFRNKLYFVNKTRGLSINYLVERVVALNG